MADKPIIQVEGLAELVRSLNQLGEDTRVEVRGELLGAARKAAAFAVFIAKEKGLYRSGDLIGGIKAGWRSSYAYITDTTTRESPAYPQGFNYPAIYEYAGSAFRRAHGHNYRIRNRSKVGVALIANFGIGEGHTGPRAYLYPAAVAGEDQLASSFEVIFDRIATRLGLATGTA